MSYNRAFHKAVRFLTTVVSTAPSPRLPSVVNLAALCGVAPRTMHNALKYMVEKGVLSVTRYPGYHVIPGAVALQPQPQLSTNVPDRESRVTSVCRSIRDDILALKWPSGSLLPSIKELTGIYETSHVTVGKALGLLVSDNHLERTGRSYRVPSPCPAPHGSSLVMIVPSESLQLISHYTPRAYEQWRMLQQTCLGRQVNLRMHVPLVSTGTGFVVESYPELVRNVESREQVLGYIVWTMLLSREYLVPLLDMLSLTGKPVSVFHEIAAGEFDLPERVYRNPLFHILGIDQNEKAGQAMGEYLLRLGHRKVLCFNYLDSEQWCDIRVRGLERAYALAGIPAAVERVPLKAFVSDRQVFQAMTEHRAIREMLGTLSKMITGLNPWTNPDSTSFYSNHAIPFAWARFVESHMMPLFEEAIQRREICAWVFTSDTFALPALRFLRQRGVKVPEQVSVAAFDDSLEAFEYGLTSYNFAQAAILESLVNHLVSQSPGKKRNRSMQQSAEIPGRIMTRQTTGVAPL